MHSVAYDQLLPVFMHYPAQVNDPSHPQVRLPIKFAGGFGLDVRQLSCSLVRCSLIEMPMIV